MHCFRFMIYQLFELLFDAHILRHLPKRSQHLDVHQHELSRPNFLHFARQVNGDQPAELAEEIIPNHL